MIRGPAHSFFYTSSRYNSSKLFLSHVKDAKWNLVLLPYCTVTQISKCLNISHIKVYMSESEWMMFFCPSVRRQGLPRSFVEEAVPAPRRSRHQHDARISRDTPCWFPSHRHIRSFPEAAPWGWVPASPPCFKVQTPTGRFCFCFSLTSICKGLVLSSCTWIVLKPHNKGEVHQLYTGKSKHHSWAQQSLLLAVLWPLFLVLSDSVTAALQSSMRRWMTVLTTCIWIGIKVRYSPVKVLGLLALRVLLIFYIYSLLFTWSLPTTVLLYLSFSLWISHPHLSSLFLSGSYCV